MAEAGARRPFFRRRKTCPFTGPNAPKIDYKDSKLLMRYVSERGKIVPSRISGSSPGPSSAPGSWACCPTLSDKRFGRR
jgi:small subunit ribosomal protein S18